MARYDTDSSSAIKPDDPNDSGNFRAVNSGENQTGNRFTDGLIDFNSYYAPDYDDQNKNSKNRKSRNEQKNSNSKDLLRRSENSSLSPSSSNQNSWQNNVQGKAPNLEPYKPKITIKNKKGALVIGIIVGIVITVSILLGSTNSLLPLALNTVFPKNSNSSYFSYTWRTAILQRYTLKHLGIKSTRKGLARLDTISDTLRTNLARNNIIIDGSGDSTVLRFYQTTAADGYQTISGENFFNEYRNNAEFRKAYNDARHGKIITYYDDSGSDYFAKNGNSRNNFKNFRETGDTDTDTAEYNKIRAEGFDNDQTTTNVRGVKDDYDNDGKPIYDTYEDGSIKYGSDGEPIIKQSVDNETIAKTTSNNTPAEARVKADAFVSDFAQKANIAGQALNAGCALYKITSTLALIITQTSKLQSSKLISYILESTNKAAYGESDSSGINIAMNLLTTPVTTTITDFYSLKVDGVGTDNPTSFAEEIEVTGSPLQAQGFQMNLSGAPVDQKSISNYSSNRIMSSLTKALNMTTASAQGCIGIQAGAAVISIIATISTLGASTIVSVAGQFFLGVGIGVTVTAFLGFLLPIVGQTLFTNIAETKIGIPLGEEQARGMSYLNFNLGRSASAQVPATKEAVLEYNNTTVKEVAALDAEVDRATLSPFDTSSPNTFLGSIAYSLLSVSISSGAASSINTILRTTSKAISTITGSVSADGEGSTYMTTFGECSADMLALGYDACDIYGEPIRISVLLDIEPDDETYLSIIESQLNEDGSIQDGSHLANFIISNMESVTDPGVINTEVLYANDVGNVVINAIPLVGDAFDIYNAAMESKNLPWSNCQYCGNSPENDLWDSEIKYFQRYIEDQRILDEISGDASANPVTAFRKKYEAEHPIDNSYAGYIAHITGLPKATVEDVIALVEYYQFIDTYDTSTRIAMIKENTTIQSSEAVIAKFDSTRLNFSPKTNSRPGAETETLLAKQSEQYIIYADIRNRSYAT